MAQAIDTLYIFGRLKTTFTEEQAESITTALAEIVDNNLVTKQNLKELENKLIIQMKELESRLQLKMMTLMKWIGGMFITQTFLLIGVVMGFFKLFGAG